jgi:hypothetical protein
MLATVEDFGKDYSQGFVELQSWDYVLWLWIMCDYYLWFYAAG